MNKFRTWYLTNQIKITWFIIGLLIAGAISDLARGNIFGVVLNLALAVANYWLGARDN